MKHKCASTHENQVWCQKEEPHEALVAAGQEENGGSGESDLGGRGFSGTLIETPYEPVVSAMRLRTNSL